MVKPSIMEFRSKQFGSSVQNEGKGKSVRMVR